MHASKQPALLVMDFRSPLLVCGEGPTEARAARDCCLDVEVTWKAELQYPFGAW